MVPQYPKRINMKVIISMILFQITFFTSMAQRGEYCSCRNVGKPILRENFDSSIQVKSVALDDSLHLTIKNKSFDTIYLFKSYFDRDIALSEYLYRYNKVSKKVNISFSPLVSYLYPTYSDNIIFQDRILQEYQVVYDFYVVGPGSELDIDLQILNLRSKRRFIKEFDVKKLGKYKKLKNLSYVDLGTNLSYSVTVAYYKSISLLCDKNAFYSNELMFDYSSKHFTEISSPLKVLLEGSLPND